MPTTFRVSALGPLLFTAALLGLSRLPASAEPPADLEQREEQAIKQAAALVAPSLVRIETVGGLDRVGQIIAGTGPTTGLVVSADGYVISSSFNFINRPASILVTLPDGRKLAAEQVASDKVRMLTLLKVEADQLTPAQAAPAESFRVGQWALALGRAYDDPQPSISVGIVSALNRIWGKALQTDAKVSPVNYGGALVDIQGRVLGVLVPMSPQGNNEVAGVEWYDGGIGFAVPLADVYAQLDRLKQGQDLVPGVMGITLSSSNIYEGQPTIDRVRFGSPAQEAGLKEKDQITALDGSPVVRQAQVMHVLGRKYSGDKVRLTIRRGDETLDRELTLTDKLVPYESAFLGVLPSRPGSGAPAGAGVALRYVYAESPAAKAGLERGHRILSVAGTPTNDSATLLDVISRRRPGEPVALTFQAGDSEQSATVTLAPLPDTVPADLKSSPTSTGEKPEGLKLGRLTDRLASHEHDYWAYVPDDYHPDNAYALVVWMHPSGDTMEASQIKAWQPLCDERGIIFLAPKAKDISGWKPDEAEFVKDLVEQFVSTYRIDRQRIVVHGYATGGGFAQFLALKYRDLFRGVSLVGAAPFQPLPDNEPDHRLQYHFISGDADPVHRAVLAVVKLIQEAKFPVVHTIVPGGEAKYPGSAELEQLARWIDSLDRI